MGLDNRVWTGTVDARGDAKGVALCLLTYDHRFEILAAMARKLRVEFVGAIYHVITWLEMRERDVFFRGMTAWMGFKTVQVPFAAPARRAGKSGWSYFKRWKLAMIEITTLSSLQLHLVTFAGLVFFLFAVGLGIQTLHLKPAGRAFTGFATVILSPQ